MTNIAILNGQVREMEEEDISSLVYLSDEEEIRNFYFIKKVDSLQNFWGYAFEEQRERRKYIGSIRQTYKLVIEELGLIKGILDLGLDLHCYNHRHVACLSYFVGAEFRRQGLGKRVLTAAIPHIFDSMDTGAIEAICLIENISSRRLLQGIGMNQIWQGVSEGTTAHGREVVVYNKISPYDLSKRRV